MLWLIGMMGSGKSSVGAILASVTGLPFIDTDALIVEQSGETISELFARGEPVFREWERCAIATAADAKLSIVATGGGAVLTASSRSRMQEGTVVWLQATVDELARRAVVGEPRPLLVGGVGALSTLLDERTALYAGIADIVVGTDGSTKTQVAQAILDAWQR
jgi:shikimate kinase